LALHLTEPCPVQVALWQRPSQEGRAVLHRVPVRWTSVVMENFSMPCLAKFIKGASQPTPTVQPAHAVIDDNILDLDSGCPP
jgi:hypothetical protein